MGFIDVMYSITEFKRKAFALTVQALSRYSNKWVNAYGSIHG